MDKDETSLQGVQEAAASLVRAGDAAVSSVTTLKEKVTLVSSAYRP